MASRSVTIEFLGKDKSLGATATSVEQKFGKLGGRLDKVGQAAGKLLVGGAVLAGAALYKMGQAAADDEMAQAKLADTLRTAVGATDGQIASTEAWIAAQGKALGVTDDELRPAMAKLATATGDVEEAQRLATIAMDVAAARGISLEQVTTAMEKAQNGSVGGLGRLGIATKNAAGETLSLEQITAKMAKTYKGAAANAADTTAGKQKKLSVAFGELQEQIGAKVLPIMLKLSQVGLKVVDWISRNTKVVGIFLAVVGGGLATLWAISAAMRLWTAVTKAHAAVTAAWTAVQSLAGKAALGTRIQLAALAVQQKVTAAATAISTAATGLWTTATTLAGKAAIGTRIQMALLAVQQKIAAAASKAFAVAQWLVNAAMTANPIGIVVVAIAALVAGLVIAYKKSETFRKIVDGAFKAVKNAAKALGGFIAKWSLPGLFIRHWGTVKSATVGAINAVVGFVRAIPGKFKAGLSNLKGMMRDLFLNAMNAGLEKVRNIGGTIMSWIAGIPRKLKEKLGDFKEAGKALIGGVVDGMKNAAGIVSGIAGNVWNAVKGLLNGAIDKINAALEFKISLPGPDVSINPPNIPHLARGTNFHRGGLALVGEEGPELVNLPRGSKVTPHGESMGAMRGLGAGGGPTVVFTGQVFGDPRVFAREVRTMLLKEKRLLGTDLGLA